VRQSQISLLCFLLSFSAVAVTRSVWDGVYTKEQALRGQDTYQQSCTQCHGSALDGGEAPPLAGDEFLRKWYGKTAGDLFDKITKTMPDDDPGNLSGPEYADLVAYILSMNSFPAGQKELDSEAAALQEIRIEAKR
jgi:mono/diheme cytochrome c family protein